MMRKRWATPPAIMLLLILLMASRPAEALPPAEPVLRLTAGDFGALVAPESERREVPLTLRFSCSVPELRSVKDVDAAHRLAETPPAVTASVAPSSHSQSPAPQEECSDDSLRHEMNMTVQLVVDRSVPAFSPLTTRVESRVTIHPAEGGDETFGPTTINLTVLPGFSPGLRITPHGQILKVAEGNPARFNVSLESDANGESFVDISLKGYKGNITNASFPSRIRLANPLNDSAASRAAFTLAVTPHRSNPDSDFVAFSLVFRQSSPDARGLAVDEQELPLSIEMERSLENVPGLGAPAAMAAAVLLLFALGRRRRV